MKKCAIITFNQAINFGAVLQMYSLNHQINMLGSKCEVLDYRSPKLDAIYRRKKYTDLINPRTLGSAVLNNSFIRYNYDGFENFKQKHIIFSEQVYRTSDDLKSSNSIYDIFISGSDQVFNPYCSHFDYNYFLEFVEDNRKKYSYAASIGLSFIPDEIALDLKKHLMTFQNISIREITGAKLIEQLLNKKVSCNVDPIFLTERDEWEEISSAIDAPSKYVLVYLLAEDKEIFTFAKNLAKQKGAKIIYINDRLIKQPGVHNFRGVTPEQWIWLFIHADAVITNSFHGTAFSLYFEKELYPFLLKSNSKVNSRIIDLLHLASNDNNLRYNGFEFEYSVEYFKNSINFEKKKSRDFIYSILQN